MNLKNNFKLIQYEILEHYQSYIHFLIFIHQRTLVTKIINNTIMKYNIFN